MQTTTVSSAAIFTPKELVCLAPAADDFIKASSVEIFFGTPPADDLSAFFDRMREESNLTEMFQDLCVVDQYSMTPFEDLAILIIEEYERVKYIAIESQKLSQHSNDEVAAPVLCLVEKIELQVIQDGVKRGCAQSQLKLAQCLLSASDLTVPDTRLALELLSKASLLGNLDAQMQLAAIYETGYTGADGVHIAQDKYTAYSMYYRCTENEGHDGYALALEKVGDYYLDSDIHHGNWVSPEYSAQMAFIRYEQAALKGLASAEFKQAILHKEGRGTPVNIPMAQYMLHKSCTQGYEPALKEYADNRELYT